MESKHDCSSIPAVIEVKHNDIKQGIAQGTLQLKAVLTKTHVTNSALAFVSYGIVTDSMKWQFLEYLYNSPVTTPLIRKPSHSYTIDYVLVYSYNLAKPRYIKDSGFPAYGLNRD
ncbi:hypothetical protein BGZ54_003019 [Gamsiella multidivaricata]|nr:hypothetical protein BGZ54_003019 [Gamsiella multidivaricata]